MLLTVSNKEGSKNTVSDQTCSNISKCHLINSEVLGSYIRRYFKREDKLLVATSSGGASTSSSCLPINIIHDCLSKIVLGANVHYIEKDERSCKAMRKRFKKKGTDLKLERNSLSKMEYEEGTFNVILDACATSQCASIGNDLIEECNQIFSNVSKALKDGGRYLLITDANESIVNGVLASFKENWFIRLQSMEIPRKTVEQSLTVYSPLVLFVLTKLKLKLPRPVIELSFMTEKVQRLETGDGLKKSLDMSWNYTFLQHKLRHHQSTVIESIDVWSTKTNSDHPRYTLAIVDTGKEHLKAESGSCNGKFGVFIVPKGREISWLYSSDKGRRKLALQACFERLAIASTHRGHYYKDLEQIKSELSTCVMQVAPPGINTSLKVPFITSGEDAGHREVKFETGDFSDGYIIEDIQEEDGFMHRRLIFKKNPRIVQTECRLVSVESSKEAQSIDYGFLVFHFHRRMIAALSYIGGVSLESDLQILLIGLGGGALSSFINRVFFNAIVTCVELDAEIAGFAKKWFGFQENDKSKLVIADGMKCIEADIAQGKEDTYDAMIFDVNTEDDTQALTGPPICFLEEKVMHHVVKLLKPNGVFIFNLVCRDEEMRSDIAKSMKDFFKTVRVTQGDEDELNTIVSCLSPKRSETEPSDLQCMEFVQMITQKASNGGTELTMDLESMIHNFNTL